MAPPEIFDELDILFDACRTDTHIDQSLLLLVLGNVSIKIHSSISDHYIIQLADRAEKLSKLGSTYKMDIFIDDENEVLENIAEQMQKVHKIVLKSNNTIPIRITYCTFLYSVTIGDYLYIDSTYVHKKLNNI